MTQFLAVGQLGLNEIALYLHKWQALALPPQICVDIQRGADTVEQCLQPKNGKDPIIYGVNTGFGILANTRIPTDQLTQLQENLLLSHAAGVGALLPDDVVRIILLLKINSLARGYSGIRLAVIERLLQFYHAQYYPCIPAQGSVGASGDLAPLAHLSLPVLGHGFLRHEGKIYSGQEALQHLGLEAMSLAPKEGLALLNGTQVSTALALTALVRIRYVFAAALLAGALTVDAMQGSDVPFDERILMVRGHPSGMVVASVLRTLLAGSALRASHQHCEKVQDPYSLRCQPQVMGACLDQINFATQVLLREANGVTDNPLVFADTMEILSGGNFHAESVAMAADNLALAIAEIGSLSERRLALLIDPHFSGLPAFLVANNGVNSGFMIPQVTAAALVSENKSLAHPSSVDSLPTSCNQEDHVSMATYAARRLQQMAENAAAVVAIELMAAAQAIDFRAPVMTSTVLQAVHQKIRSQVPFYEKDRVFSPEIQTLQCQILAGEFSALMPQQLTIFSN